MRACCAKAHQKQWSSKAAGVSADQRRTLSVRQALFHPDIIMWEACLCNVLLDFNNTSEYCNKLCLANHVKELRGRANAAPTVSDASRRHPRGK